REVVTPFVVSSDRATDIYTESALYGKHGARLYRQADRNSVWQDITGPKGFVCAAGIDPYNTSHLLVSNLDDVISVSNDAGSHWQPSVLPKLQVDVAFACRRIVFGFDQRRPKLVYLSVGGGSFLISTNAGRSF